MRIWIFLTALMIPVWAWGQDEGRFVVVLYNSKMPESKDVAEHYAQVRHVPSEQVLGFDLPATETMTRAEFTDQLEKPLLERLQNLGLLVFDNVRGSNGWPDKLIGAKVRYLAPCYGVPLKILQDDALVEPNMDKVQAELKVNYAAVDSELELLPSAGKYMVTGVSRNPVFATTNRAVLNPAYGVIAVGRLDGPNATIARHLVDKAIQAETDGLWGRVYIDERGFTNGPYLVGDEWMRAAATVSQSCGFDTIVDTNPATFPRDFPMSQIALYAGWYEGQASGPFTLPQVEFMPGAFAYHLFSFSAWTLRGLSATEHPWCATLLSKGATATMGCVNEPYLAGTPNIGVFFERWLGRGFSFGEAALVCQEGLSWQTTVIGDPLYRPFGKTPKEQHEELLAKKSDLAAWSFVRIVNMQMRLGLPLQDSIRFLEQEPMAKHSAVMTEKLAGLYQKASDRYNTLRLYGEALRLKPTPQQKIRLKNEIEEAKKMP